MSKATRKKYFSNPQRQKQRNQRARALNSYMMNERSGEGGRQDRSFGERPTIHQWANPFVYSKDQLFAARYAWVLHESDWMAQKIIDIPVFDMFREGWDWKYKGDDNGVDKALEDECKRLKFMPTLINAKKLERLVGGCVAIRITKGYDAEKTEDPQTPDMIGQRDILGYNIVPPMYISKVEWEMDPSKPEYGRPKHYYIRDHIYHRSRLVIFDGQPISPYPQIDFATYAVNWNGFGLSKLAPIWDVMMRANSYQQGASHLAQMASVWFALYKGLRDIKATRQGNAALEEMRDIMETMSQYKAVILDGEDVDVKTIGAQFGSVPELLMSGLQIVCAAADIPASRFLGQAPGGLSTDDRSGLENYYNDIAAHQKMELDPILDSEKRYLLNSALGTGAADPNQITQEWIPLWNLSDTEKAQVRTLDTNNIINMANSLGMPDEWAVDELVRRDVITVKPDLEAMERERMLDELRNFGQPMGGDGASATDDERITGGNGIQMPSVSATFRKPRMPAAMNAGDWDEAKHPRADDGKFGKGSGGESGGSEDESPFADVREWGEAFPQYSGKPAEAIEHLMREKSGYVPGAFERNDIGPIDLPYGKGGKGGYGIAHIIERRNQQGFDGESFVRDLPKLVSEGVLFKREEYPNKRFIAHEGKEAIIRLDWNRQKKTWIATAFYRFD